METTYPYFFYMHEIFVCSEGSEALSPLITGFLLVESSAQAIGYLSHTIVSGTERNVMTLTSKVVESLFSHPYVILFVGAATVVVYRRLQNRHTPPGPPRLPFLGNILQVPRQFQSLPFLEWSTQYGPIFSLDLLGQNIIVLNTFKAASDLLDHRSNIYNSRPHMTMVQDIICGGTFPPLEADSDLWRKWRRASHETYGPEGVEKYQANQAEAAALATLRTIIDPNGWENNIEVYTASIIFSTVYGWPPLEANSPALKVAFELSERISSSIVPGAFLVDIFPLMKFLPAWMARWKREGMTFHDKMSAVLEKYFADAIDETDSGNVQTCYVSELARTVDRHGFSKKTSAWISGTMLAAGADTITTSLSNFLLAMLNYPDVMRKAQAELDEVVGRERIPTFGDKDNLPYIRAIVRETLRWRPVSPIGLPHVATEDNWYEGYFIPKGTAVFGNIWAMNRDPSIYPDFDVFRPERFLDESGAVETSPPNARQSGHATFGFGRRICIGMHFADQALFIAIATMLWAFDIKPPVNKNGDVVIPPTDQWVDAGTAVRSAPFECRFSVRSSDAQTVLENCISTS
ncbi:cytochrome P450 [Irpex rosettiformis]|uniref:Cytochrome P450 n=1 Tax=Irpex rosettiformis TaxID=378272 RepID=A0ACB8U2H8_9APHY|nr:cytochrome P450 [Irpex rosettiformis]